MNKSLWIHEELYSHDYVLLMDEMAGITLKLWIDDETFLCGFDGLYKKFSTQLNGINPTE